ncbi:hypothetical protein Ait01nite_014850 [Actinoplanes italicus]|uniref:Secreted protein n=1 Tax=Actinoplanes italicus TaxID=113567 RepID=A0A2T0KHJ6_9ACTN|nr:hypothetical protein [Actinoplanes italicus]PRX22919.1 hypothetical protein CLV67_104447 [Actinoplanes italicus]GIE28440.1 hypothetical protein Ait01nite_014850 [Actinoplanes italicus]
MRFMRKRVLAAAALFGLLGSLVAAGPAQAAPSVLNQSQVNETTNRTTPRGPYTTRFGVTIELRAGWYQGFQYGWARVSASSRWQEDDVIWLRIYRNGSREFTHPSFNDGSGQTSTHTAGQITLADPNYRFSACLQRGNEYDCTSEW